MKSIRHSASSPDVPHWSNMSAEPPVARQMNCVTSASHAVEDVGPGARPKRLTVDGLRALSAFASRVRDLSQR